MRRRAAYLCLRGGAVGVLSVALALLSVSFGRAQTSPEPSSADTTPQSIEEAPTPVPDPATPAPTTTPGTPPPTPTPSPSALVTPAPALEVPQLERTPPRNSTALVESLLPMTEWGLPLEQVLVEGIGRFPVACYAHYSDDWLAARYNPTPHLHRGLDIFAAVGTPIRAPDAGVVTNVSDSFPGGKSVTMRVYDGTLYYFAHLSSRAWGLLVGQSVEVGTVLGYVGDTGNAQGGAPHLHLEVTKEGTTVPPKPIVDAWLDEAEASAGDWMERKRLEIDVARRLPVCSAEPPTGPNLMLLQILDDPIGLDLGAGECESEPVAEPDPLLVDILTTPSA